MTLMETMQTMDSGLTEREKDIRRYLLDHPEKVELFSARELGAATFTSAASVTRFCQKIGCKGYPDFKLRFLAELRQASSQAHAIEGEVLMTPRENAVSLLRKITEVQHRSVEQTRAETVSQLSTLDANIRQLKVQLQNLIGEDPTGEIALGALPTQEEMAWEAPDYEADLEAAKAASWTLRSAQLTLDDAKETWDDAKSDYRGASKQYLYQQAEHTWNAAQLTYQSTVQNFETGFKSLYDSLANYEQVLENAQSALVWKQTLLNTAQTRYQLGQISHNEVLTAQDDVAAAQSAVDSAWRDLFSARNSYRWAVETGLMTSAQG